MSEAKPPDADAAEPEAGKSDLRHGAHADLKVEVTRDLTGSGHLARGGATRFSKLKFRSVGVPQPPAPQAEASSTQVEDAPEARPAAARPPPPAEAAPTGGVLDTIAALFRRGS